ncbi:MAG TPA: RHS repeat protein, partial [Promineifilum sp.]|nr:RHS repeat protein [Promineifilum sp.]
MTALTAPVGTDSVAYAYDNLGRLLTAAIPSQTTTRVWDALGRLTSETGPLGTMSYGYDVAGRRTQQTWPDSFSVTNVWNPADQMTAILHGGVTPIVGFTYDSLGRREGVTRAFGINTAYVYDGIGRLSVLQHDLPGTADDVMMIYGHNPAGQIFSRSVSNNAYVRAPAGGTRNYVNDGLNRISNAGGWGLTYDGNGNLTWDSVRTYTYDAASRLTGMAGSGSSLSYDGLGRLYDYVGTYGGRYIYDGAET